MMAAMREGMVAAMLVVGACGDPTVTVTVTEADGSRGVFVAYQDGDGPWRAAEASSDTYAFDVSSGRYGVAVWCAAPQYRRVVFDYLTTDELTDLAAFGGCPQTDLTLSGRVFNLADNAQVSWSYAAVTANLNGSYALQGPTGTHDLVATSYQLGGGGRTIDAVVIVRDQTVGGNDSIDVDLDADDRIELDTHDLTVEGELADDFASVSSAFYSAARTSAALSSATGDALTFQALPEDALIDGDRQSSFLQVSGPAVAGQPQRLRTHVAHTETSADRTVELLAATDPPDVSAGPTFTWSPLDGADAYQLSVIQTDGGGAAHDYGGAWSPGYLGADVVLTLPDLSDVDGWDDRVELVDGATMFWSLSARTSNLSLGRLLSAPVAGLEVSTTGWYGSFAP